MTTKLFATTNLRHLALLLFVGLGLNGSLRAQTFTNGNYITTTQNLEVKHKQSFLADRADALAEQDITYPLEFLQKGQGWKENPYSHIQVQNTSEYYTTRYVKQGEWAPLFLTTNNAGTASLHTFYQRWYYYDDTDGSEKPLPQEYYAPEYKAYVYKNGLVMGGRLYNGNQNLNNNTVPVTYSILSRLPNDKESMVIGADLSRYSDMAYANPNNNNDQYAGNLTEPSLTLRHYFKLVDAKVMAERLTAMTYGSDKWLEEHTIHFPSRTIGLRRDHVPLDLELQDYWFFTRNTHTDANLQNISSNNYITIETYYPGANLGIQNVGLINAPANNRNTPNDYPNIEDTPTLRRRLIGFAYPNSGEVPADSKMEIRVYARTSNANNATRFQLAKFTIIFDGDSETLPWMDVLGDGAKNNRSPQSLRALVGGDDPVAHIDFDYPKNQSFTTPAGVTRYNNNNNQNAGSEFPMSSALPLSFSSTNYGYATFKNDNVYNWCVWGEYGVGKETGQGGLKVYPVSRKTGDMVDKSLEAGFLYIDASDLPGTIATIPFEGTMCMGTRLMCTGWLASITNNVPGSVILKVMGTTYEGKQKEIYAYCPGQIGNSYRRYGATSTTASSGEYCWQQFYFDFFLDEPCVSYELRVENNCESTQGGDYFLDDIWVFAQKPKVGPEMTTPLCGGSLEVVQLETNFESLLLAAGLPEAASSAEAEKRYLSFLYLDWDKFLLDFQQGLKDKLGEEYGGTELQERINAGFFDAEKYMATYRTAFAGALLRHEEVDTEGNVTQGGVVYGNYQWSSYFNDQPAFTFASMANDTESKIFGLTGADGQRRLVFNGSMGISSWEFYHNYALLTTMHGEIPMTETEAENGEYIADLLFNVLNECSNRSILWFVPKVQILGTVGGLSIDQLEFCENTTHTFAMELTGYTRKDGYTDDDGDEHGTGDLVVMKDVYFDWWMGIPASSEGVGFVPGTVENYMKQYKEKDGSTSGEKIYLYDALRAFRFMNPDATSLYSPNIKFGKNPLYDAIPEFTSEMLDYLRELANPSDGSDPQLYIHTKIVDVKIDESNTVEEDYLGIEQKFVKFVAIPIEANLNQAAKEFVYICAEPQPFQIKVGAHAPSLNVGFSDKAYPSGLGTLSVRITKSQFDKLVDRGDGQYKTLHIPLRNINVITSECMGVKRATENEAWQQVLIANSTDSLMQDYIMQHYDNLLPPPVGKVDYLLGRHENFYDKTKEEQRLLKLHFDDNFQVREGYSYTLRYYYIEEANDGTDLTIACEGNGDILLKIVPDYEVWTGGADNTDWSNDENWRRADYGELYAQNGTTLRDNYLPNGEQDQPAEETNYVTNADRERRQGFAPLYCTNILMATDETAPAASLYDDGYELAVDGETKTGFPALRPTSSPLIRYDFQTHEWGEGLVGYDTYTQPSDPNAKRNDGDMITELYTTNVCDKIAFQPETELVNAYYLNYSKAWVEFGLGKNQWHLVSSPLQGMISGEWYAPTYSARQETTYFEPITFDTPTVTSVTMPTVNYTLGYDRFAPAVYQRAWDKAKAVVYERGAAWSSADGDQNDTTNTGDGSTGQWGKDQNGEGYIWDNAGADEYLERLVYKPMGYSKANVAIRGTWSGVYNDHTVPYDGGGFSVLPINHLKDSYNNESIKTIFRLPKDDQYYDIWDWSKSYELERRVRVYIDDGRTLPEGATTKNTLKIENRGRLRTDVFAANPSATYDVTLSNEGKGSVGFFLAANPFICGLDMQKFFAANDDLAPYYLVLKDSPLATTDDLTGNDWKWTEVIVNGQPTDGDGFAGLQVVPARHAFFVRAKEGGDLNAVTVHFRADMMAATPRTTATPAPTRRQLTIRAERDGNSSEAVVVVSREASNQFRPEEDMETFVVSDLTSAIPVVYTLNGRLATSVNRLQSFTTLPLGIESDSTEPAVLTFSGIDALGLPLQLYDAHLGTLLPLTEGMKVRVPGSTQNRFFILTAVDEATMAESNIRIIGREGGVHVVSTTGLPLTAIEAYDMAGRRWHSAAPAQSDYTARLPKGVYIVKAATDDSRQQRKVVVE